MSLFNELLKCLNKKSRIVIQTHDFPDHDAVGSAYALGQLLELQGFTTTLCYAGRLESTSLSNAVEELKIPLHHSSQFDLRSDDQCIIVDGMLGSSNVSNVPGQVIGTIDHHSLPAKPNIPFHDVQEDIGACSTIIYSYFKDADVKPSQDTATAMLMGILMDTAFITRGVSREDMTAFSDLFFMSDWQFGIRLLKNSLRLHDLQVFREAINSCEVAGEFAFVPIQKECSAEVMALTADFFLDIQEITFVVVLVPDRNEYRLSVRSEDLSYPANLVIQLALDGIGYGGGHIHMGGGSIPRDLFPGQEGVRKRFLEAINGKQSE